MDSDANDTIKIITEAPVYVPNDQQLFDDWWGVLTGRISHEAYFSNFSRHLTYKANEGYRAGQELSTEIERGLDDPGLQVLLMQFGAVWAAERQLEAGSLKLVNKGFPYLKGTTTNCVNCVVAFDATLAGRPASALPGPVQGLSVLERTFGTVFSPPTSIASIETEMMAAGSGARGIVFGESVSGGVGHVVNVVNQRGAVRFLDSQSGTVANFGGLTNFRLLRTN